MFLAAGLVNASPTAASQFSSLGNEPPPEECPPAADELTQDQEQTLWHAIQANISALRGQGRLTALNSALPVTYTFPLRLAPGLPDYAGYRVSAFSDHHPGAGQVLDYNGGTRTYDGHRGTDYALWPYSWNKVDAGAVQVIAAAAGTIINSVNADPSDHNCGTSSSDPWNYITLLHADGRLSIYGHMRYNSLTTKTAGQSVAQGEYLGTAASSGNSSGAHLHFEVRYGGFSSSEWLDPYAGPNSQAESLWANQLAYYDSAINKLSTHSAPPASPDPCLPATTNLQDSFSTPARVYFYAYYRDFQNVLPTSLKVYRPDGSIYSAWQYAPGGSDFHSIWSQAWVYDFTSSDPAGTWRFEATYNGQSYATFFNLNAPPTIHITSPNGGEQWNKLQARAITWTDNFGGDVNIALYRGGVYAAPIAYNTPGDGEYLWTPDASLEPATDYSIRVSGVLNPAVLDVSNTPFSIFDSSLVARDDHVLVLVNTPVSIDALANDADALGEPLTITAVGPALYGNASLNNGQVLYTPSHNFVGTDSFSYTVSTGTETASASVTLFVASQFFHISLPAVLR